MQVLLLVCSVILMAVVFWDAFITVFSTHGAGPLTRWWTGGVWRLLLMIHHRRPIHRVLSMAGPVMLLAVVCVWYALLATGWVMFFCSGDALVVDNLTQEPANIEKIIYFVGTTLAGVGYGDLVPGRFPWTLWSNFAAFTSTVLLTTSLSYLLPIVAASLERMYLAQRIFGIGKTVPEFIVESWQGRSSGALDQYLLSLSAEVDRHAHKHLAYPILQYFHSADWKQSPGKAMLMFADAIFLISCGAAESARPPRPFIKLVNASIDNYAQLATAQAMLPGHIDSVNTEALRLDTLRKMDIPVVDEAEFDLALRSYAKRRGKLVALCEQDGWR
ncbi:ion channel [Bremerella alba]|uniref:Potassium channel domain-containing protein n=1 Tax=Bremerella alba TaxID=980252 RepID=A0A7V8V8C2_9BACT|nr:ion channel [Bremerella alba]MBA2116808.1 hypothetical protein [Bremerella alba]